jgi:hypothetical protein
VQKMTGSSLLFPYFFADNVLIYHYSGFSHHDRIGGDQSLLDLDRIQKTICEGKDIFNMLPEASLLPYPHIYTHTDLTSSPRHTLCVYNVD